MGYVVAASGASREMMRTMGNSGAAILSKIVESIGKTAIRRAVSLLFVIGGVVVSLGLAFYIWINKKLKQMKDDSQAQMQEELRTQITQLGNKVEQQYVIKTLNDTRLTKLEENQTKQQEELSSYTTKYPTKINLQELANKLTDDMTNKSADLDQKLQKTEDSRQEQMKKELQTQITQLEQNVIKNLNGTLDKRLTNLEEKQQEDIKNEMSTYYIQHLNTLEEKLMNTIEEKLTADVAKKSADLDQTLKEIWEKQNKQLEKHDKQMAEIHQAFVATMKKAFVNLYEAQSAGTRKEEHQSRSLSYAQVTEKSNLQEELEEKLTNVIKNLTCTFNKTLTNLVENQTKQQEDIKNEMLLTYTHHLNNLYKKFTADIAKQSADLYQTLKEIGEKQNKQQEDIKNEMLLTYTHNLNNLDKKFTADIAKKSADLDKKLKEIGEKQNKQLEKHDKQMEELNKAFVATMQKAFVHLYNTQPAGTRKEKKQPRATVNGPKA